MTRESLAELDAIEPRLQNRPEVLHLRLHHLMQRKSWRCAFTSAENFAASLRNAAPVFSTPDFVCTSLARRPRRANFCSPGPLLREEPIYYYNMGCYEALLGNPDKARHISKSVSRWTLLSRAREKRSGPRIAPASDLSAIQDAAVSKSPNIKIGRFGKRASVITLRHMTRTSDGLIKRIAPLFEENFAQFGELGAAISIWQNGKPLLELHGGFRDANRQKPWTADTIVLFWSATKGLGQRLPASCPAGTRDRTRATRRGVLAGICAGRKERNHACAIAFPSSRARARSIETVDVTDYPAVIRALEKQAPLWPPGTAHGYHARTFGFLVDELMRRIAANEFGEYWRKTFAEPLHLDIWIGLPNEQERTRGHDLRGKGRRRRERRRSSIATWPRPERWSEKHSLRPADCTPSAT